jgi:succinate-semialdehyde dehydrogenase/glutarate-semialdehyde dehydrogenase
LINSKRKTQERASVIENLGQVIKKNKKKLSELITEEMGKPIIQSQMEVDRSVRFCDYYSHNYNDLNPTHVKTDAKIKTLIKYLPMGTVYIISPFNFPLYLILKSGIPNLLLGNAMLSRSSDSTPLLANKI